MTLMSSAACGVALYTAATLVLGQPGSFKVQSVDLPAVGATEVDAHDQAVVGVVGIHLGLLDDEEASELRGRTV